MDAHKFIRKAIVNHSANQFLLICAASQLKQSTPGLRNRSLKANSARVWPWEGGVPPLSTVPARPAGGPPRGPPRKRRKGGGSPYVSQLATVSRPNFDVFCFGVFEVFEVLGFFAVFAFLKFLMFLRFLRFEKFLRFLRFLRF